MAGNPDVDEIEAKLTLEPEPGTIREHHGDGDVSRLHFYESSVRHEITGEPLLTVVTKRHGMRLTQTQARELRDWLDRWLGLGSGVERLKYRCWVCGESVFRKRNEPVPVACPHCGQVDPYRKSEK